MSVHCPKCGEPTYISARHDRMLHVNTNNGCPQELHRRRILLGVIAIALVLGFILWLHITTL